MISMTAEDIRHRAERLCEHLRDSGFEAEVLPGLSVIGGGSTPDQALPTFLIAIHEENGVAALERALRKGEPAVVARIEDDRLVLDLRTVFETEEDQLELALMRARDSSRRPSKHE
jgi:L-seryl-tRNA(Ser) seleniumtransferase